MAQAFDRATNISTTAALPQPTRPIVQADDSAWEAKLAATPPQAIDTLTSKVRADIAAGKTRPFPKQK